MAAIFKGVTTSIAVTANNPKAVSSSISRLPAAITVLARARVWSMLPYRRVRRQFHPRT